MATPIRPPFPSGATGQEVYWATDRPAWRAAVLIDARDYRAGQTTNWQSALDAATGSVPVLLIDTTPYYLDITPGNQYTLASGQAVRGNPGHVIRAINGDSVTVTGSGLYVSAVSSDRTRAFLEYLNVEGENGSGWGDGNDHSFAFSPSYQTMVARFLANGSGILRDFGVRFSRFAYLDGFPVQVIGVSGNAFGGYFDFNTLYRVNRAMNVSSPYSSISFNKFEESQVAEFAAPMMTVLANIARKHYGNFSMGASSVGDWRYYGQAVALNLLDEQIQTNGSFQIGTTDGAAAGLIALNVLKRANSAGILIGGTISGAGSPYVRAIGNMIISAGNVANGLSRVGIQVKNDYADLDLNTVVNDSADAGVWTAQTGLLIQANYGSYDRNRVSGTSNSVQFDGTGTNDKAIENYWGAGNIYDPSKVSFLRPPTGASYFLDGSFLRGTNVSPGVSNRPTASVNYRGLTWSYQSNSTGYGDATFKCVRLPSGNYGWVHWGEDRIRNASASFTATAMDNGVVVMMTTGATDKTVTLPAAASNEGMVVTLVKVDAGAGAAVFDGNSAETINGAVTLPLASQWDRAKIYCTGSQWVRID